MSEDIKAQAKLIPVIHNVKINVIDQASGKIVASHTGHNAATMSMVNGIGHYLTGDGVLNQGYHMLSDYVPKYISLGTMGLINQDEDGDGLPAGLGNSVFTGKYTPEGKPIFEIPDDENERLREYLLQSPGFGADGYDANSNNGREHFGLGPMYKDRIKINLPETCLLGDVNNDGKVDAKDVMLLADYLLGHAKFTEKQKMVANLTKYFNGDDDDVIDYEDLTLLRQFVGKEIYDGQGEILKSLGTVEYVSSESPAIDCELISDSFPRAKISYREIVPETDSELPQTIDVIFSAMISTGALAQFRGDKDYIFITEAGLWSKREWTEGGDNGLLAGYRLAPNDALYWGMTDEFITDEAAKRYLDEQKQIYEPTPPKEGIPEYDAELKKYEAAMKEYLAQVESVKSETAAYNKKLLKESILRVGKNQVVQVIWKIQIGALEQLGGVGDLYGVTGALYWTDWDNDEE